MKLIINKHILTLTNPFLDNLLSVEMAQLVKAQVLYARKLDSECESPWIKKKYI